MKKKYIYNIGDIVDDQKIIDIIKPIKGSGTSEKYKVVCLRCGRTKLMEGHRLFRHNGTTHKACGKGLKLANPRFYRIWSNMRSRTNNEHTDHYNDYGGRGIDSKEFEIFIDFYDSLFESYVEATKLYGEDKVSLERIDVNGNYTKENCKWIHISEQMGNTRSTVYFEITFPNGKTEIQKNITKFAKDNNLNVSCLTDLINGRLRQYKGFRGKRINKESVTTN